MYIRGKCHGCGNCCKGIHLRYQKGWVKTKGEFLEVLNDIPEYSRFIPREFTTDTYLLFDCSKYDSQQGCLDYENRLDICKRYPSKYLLLHGGELQDGCGYTLKVLKPFSKYLQDEMSKNTK